MLKQAVILAGGKGTRLRDRLGNKPKPLIDVYGVPLLERQIQLLKRNGINRVILLVNYQAEYIRHYCGERDNWGIEITCIDDGKPSGTAGAVLKVLKALDDEVLVLYGDTMLEVDLARFYKFHSEARNVAATLFIHPNDHPHDSDLVDLDANGRITHFYPYPHPEGSYLPNLVNAALYIIRTKAFTPWCDQQVGVFDFGKQLFPMMIAAGHVLRGYNSPEYIKDCGTPARVDKVSADWASGKILRSTLSVPQQAVFLDRDGTINREVDHLKHSDQLSLIFGVEQAIRRLNHAEYKVCVITNQPVLARGDCTIKDLKQIHNKLETILGRNGAYLDRVYFCPHYPEQGFRGEVPELKIVCECRKPGTEMVQWAVHDLNIDLARSWMVGDSTTDIQMARVVGLRSILVETGQAGLDGKFLVTPDYIVPHLEAAVNLILDVYPKEKALAKVLLETVHAGDIVVVGGAARSGKSSKASVFRDVLRDRGMDAKILSTDKWLLSENARLPGVMGRHNMIGLQRFIKQVIEGREFRQSFHLAAYNKLTRTQVPNAELLTLMPNDVIIVEGVVALALDDPQIKAQNRFFIAIDETERQNRVLQEYHLRGYSEHEAEVINRQRLSDEIPAIEAMVGDARRIGSLFGKYNSNIGDEK